MDERLAAVRQRINAILSDRGWSGAELGRRMEPQRARGWVAARLNDNVELSLPDILQMADALNVAAATLIDDGDRPAQVPNVFTDAYERRLDAVAEAPAKWSTGIARGVEARDEELFGDAVMDAINRLDPADRKIALRLIGVLDDVLSKAEIPGR